jgi:hypothetical protein
VGGSGASLHTATEREKCIYWKSNHGRPIIYSGKSTSYEAVVVPWLRHTSLSPRRPEFASGSVHVGFVVDKVALGRVFHRGLRFFLSLSFHRGSPYSYHLEDEQQVHWWPQFRDTVSPQRHEQKCVCPSVLLVPPLRYKYSPQHPICKPSELVHIVAYSGSLFTMELYCTPKVNTLQLNTVGNSWNTRTRPTCIVPEHSFL